MNESSFFDDFGRYIGNNPDHNIIYGDNNRITSIKNSKNIPLVNYHYDEDNNPILKIKNKKLSKNIEFYFGDSVLTDDNLILPIKIQNIVVGYYKNKDFFPVSVDKRNSLVANVNNQANFSSPFGERTSRAPNSKKEDEWSQIIDYTLKGYDSDLNAVRMGSRFYDPKAKRFLTPDSFFLENPEKIVSSPIEGNLYSYARNNPISFVDPSGHCAEPISGAICTAVTVVGGTTAISTLVAYGASKAATWFNNTFRGHDATTSNITQSRVDQQFFGQNGAWTRVGKNGLNLTPFGDYFDVASFVSGRDLGQLYSPEKGLAPSIDRKDAFVGALFPMMKMRTDIFWGKGIMSNGLGPNSHNFMKGMSNTIENIDRGFDYYGSSSNFFNWGSE